MVVDNAMRTLKTTECACGRFPWAVSHWREDRPQPPLLRADRPQRGQAHAPHTRLLLKSYHIRVRSRGKGPPAFPSRSQDVLPCSCGQACLHLIACPRHPAAQPGPRQTRSEHGHGLRVGTAMGTKPVLYPGADYHM